MGNLKILSFGEKFKFSKDQQFNLRLHDHGLLRLIPLNVDKALFDATDKVFFHSLINSTSYREMFFDHFSQKSDNKHGPFLLETCLLYTSPSPRDGLLSRMPSSA